MSQLTVPQIDFSSLGQLPQIYKQGQQDALRQQTLANLGQGGQVDANTLLRSGDLSLAQLGINLRNRQEDQARQAQLDTRQTTRDTEADRHTRVMEGFAGRTANRADEEKFGIKEVTDPNTGATSFVKYNMRTGEVSPTGTPAPPSSPANPYAYPGAKPQTEAQSKDSGYANRLFRAEQVLREPATIDAATSLTQKGMDAVPVAGNYMTSPAYQKYDQAKRDFVNAVLRRESGAAISSSEFDNAYKQYFPQPGDSQERIAEKQRNRQDTIAGIAGGGGPNFRPQFTFGAAGELVPTGTGKQGAASAAPAPPKVGQLTDGYRFKGGNPADPNSWVKAQ